MTYQNENYEMIKRIILNEQSENYKKLKLIIENKALPEEVKKRIWEAVLHHAHCDRKNIIEFAKELKEAFILINA